MTYTREYFERQAEELQQENAFRRSARQETRRQQVADSKRRLGRMARRAVMNGEHEADLLDTEERAKILRLSKSRSVNEIARQMQTDLVTVAAVIEGVV